ncbi:hypothetical protein MFLAVUS_010727 [Mucor flavus]|uniref:SWIM-type domain-containing protein n=1 Tax=Mucor flavus TaxID=439312 RepID=A0ABP9ZDI9_9FUNG
MENDQMIYHCCPFTKDIIEDVSYVVTLDTSREFIEKYSCPDPPYSCKHIFLVSRAHAIPYSDKSVFAHPLVTSHDNDAFIEVGITDYKQSDR